MIELKKISFSYEKQPWIQNLNLTLQSGAIHAFIGPNGSGKSTILKIIAGILPPQEGAVLLDGANIHRLPGKQKAKRIALMGQNPRLPPFLAEDIVMTGRYPHRKAGFRYCSSDWEAVHRIMKKTGCFPLAKKRIDHLSGGERQKVFMAAALAQETDILLLDEPTAFLDIKSSIHWMQTLLALNRQQSKTIIVVLHDLALALRYFDQIVVFNHGAIAGKGTAEELIAGNVLADVYNIDVIMFQQNGRRYYCFE